MTQKDAVDYENIPKMRLPQPPAPAFNSRTCVACHIPCTEFKQISTCTHVLCLTCFSKRRNAAYLVCPHPSCANPASVQAKPSFGGPSGGTGTVKPSGGRPENNGGGGVRIGANDPSPSRAEPYSANPGINTLPRQPQIQTVTKNTGNGRGYNGSNNGVTNGDTLNGHNNMAHARPTFGVAATKLQGNGTGIKHTNQNNNKLHISMQYEEVNDIYNSSKPERVDRVGNHRAGFETVPQFATQPNFNKGRDNQNVLLALQQPKPAETQAMVSQSMFDLSDKPGGGGQTAGRGRGGGGWKTHHAPDASRFLSPNNNNAGKGQSWSPTSPVPPVVSPTSPMSPRSPHPASRLPAAAATTEYGTDPRNKSERYQDMSGAVPPWKTMASAGNKANVGPEKPVTGNKKTLPGLMPYANLVVADGDATCEQCCNKKIEQYCKDCSRYMCLPCSQEHVRNGKFVKHTVTSWQSDDGGGSISSPESTSPSDTSMCIKHKRESTKYYCFLCQALFCTVCNVEGTHAGHDMTTIAAAEAKCSAQLGTYTKIAKDELKTVTEIQNKLIIRRRNEQEKYDKAVSDTRARAAALLSAVEEWQKRILAAIEDEHEESGKYMNETEQLARNRYDDLSALLLRTEQTPSAAVALAQIVPTLAQIMANKNLPDPEVEVCKLKPGNLDLTADRNLSVAFGELEFTEDNISLYVNL